MKQLKKNLMFVGVAAFGLLLTAEAQAQVTGRAVKVRPEVSTRPETAGMSSLRMAAKNSPALRPMLQRLESMQAQGQLNVGSAREMATVISGLAVQLGLSKADLSKLPNEAQINSAIAQAADAEFSLVSKGATDSNAALGLMVSLKNANQANCDMALGKAPVNEDNGHLNSETKEVLFELNDYFEKLGLTFWFFNFQEVVEAKTVFRNMRDLINSGDNGSVDSDVVNGLGAIFGEAGRGRIHDDIREKSKDGFTPAEKAEILGCMFPRAVQATLISRGVDSKESRDFAVEAGSACSVQTSGEYRTPKELGELCTLN